jgi:predicted unusual protein kinase regulating ubiquinone biosynthesis (AarF/ABC1/UbiB family)
MKYRPIRRRANIPELLDEFARTLWDELDYVKEAANAEHFAQLFNDDPEIHIPSTFTEFCTQRILILEDVTSIKITDHAAIDEAGIDRREVAMRLFRLYMDQIFEHRFFHADPHPGNLFIHPLPRTSSDNSEGLSRPFELVFVDFGMVGSITENVLAGMREALLAVGTRDMRRLVRAYQILGILLPDADLNRIAQAEQKIFDRLWGMNMREMVDFSYQEATEIAREFRDLVYEMPFQVPQDLIYVGRALGILSGMCTNLDPDFNPWTALHPYAQKMVEEELRLGPGAVLDSLKRFGRLLLALPHFAEDVMERIENGQLEIKTTPTPEALRHQRHLTRAIDRVSMAIVFAALTGASTFLWLNGEHIVGAVGYALAGLSFVWLLFGSVKRG